MSKYIDVNKCRACGGNLVFDVYTGKKHCTACGLIWGFELNPELNKLIVREWFMLKREMIGYGKI